MRGYRMYSRLKKFYIEFPDKFEAFIDGKWGRVLGLIMLVMMIWNWIKE